LKPAWEEFFTAIQPYIPQIKEFLTYFAQFLGVVLLGAIIVVTKGISLLLSVVTTLLSKFIEFATWSINTGQKLWDGIATGAQKVATIFQTLIDLADKVGQAMQKVSSPFSNVLGKVSSYAGTAIGKVLGFADGGIVPGPLGMPVPAIVHGGETVIPAGAATGGIQIYVTGNSIMNEDMVERITSILTDKLKMQLRI
jgi:hypothetical protein